MTEQELVARLEKLEQKLDATFVSAEKTRKYILWGMISTLVTFLLPLIGLAFVIPWYLSQLQGLM